MNRKESLEEAKRYAREANNQSEFFDKKYEELVAMAKENPAAAYDIGTQVIENIALGRTRFIDYIVKSSPVIKKQYKRWQKGKVKSDEFDVSNKALEKMKYDQVSQKIDGAWLGTLLVGVGVAASGVVLKFLGAQDPLTWPIISSGAAAALLGAVIALPDIKTEKINGKKKERSRIATLVAKKFAEKYKETEIDEGPFEMFKEHVDGLISPYLDKAERDLKGVTVEDLQKEANEIMVEIGKIEDGISKLMDELECASPASKSYQEKQNIKDSLMALHHELGKKYRKVMDAIDFEKECVEKGVTPEDNFKLCEPLRKLKADFEEDLAEIEAPYKKIVSKEEAQENE